MPAEWKFGSLTVLALRGLSNPVLSNLVLVPILLRFGVCMTLAELKRVDSRTLEHATNILEMLNTQSPEICFSNYTIWFYSFPIIFK